MIICEDKTSLSYHFVVMYNPNNAYLLLAHNAAFVSDESESVVL